MPSLPTPTPATTKDDVRAFFDRLAADYDERHGSKAALLAHRLQVLDRHAQFGPRDVVLDVGCGPGTHLRPLADRIGRGIGVDLSPGMIDTARRRASHPALSFRVDDAEELDSIPSDSVDKVICVGVLEHVLRPAQALRQAARVLRPSGRFVALTLNGDYWWYRLADHLGLQTRHISTDRRFDPRRARQLLCDNGLAPDVGFWRFVPAGDLPPPLTALCRSLDALGQHLAVASLRGGLRLTGRPL